MAAPLSIDSKAYQEALKIGRPPNIVKLFPESQALIVSGKYIDNAMLAKGQAITMASILAMLCKENVPLIIGILPVR